MAELSEKDRARLAPLIRERRESVYGTKRAAYGKAGVNPSTWDRVEEGEAVRDDIMRRIVRTLWPDTDGDWRRIREGEPDAKPPGPPGAGGGVSPEVSADLRALIRATIEEVIGTTEGSGTKRLEKRA